METSPYGEIDHGELPTDCFNYIYWDLEELNPDNKDTTCFFDQKEWPDSRLFERASNYEEFKKREDLSPGTRERVAKILVGLTFEIDQRIADMQRDETVVEIGHGVL